MAVFRGSGSYGTAATLKEYVDAAIVDIVAYLTAAQAAQTAAETAQTAAETAQTAAATSATNAATSETNAATSETNAATSETNAATSATNAATSATNAATSATNAATSETNAAASAAAAALSYDSFDDRYLGSKTSDPTLDNDGNALLDGALYFNTTSNEMKVYDLGTTTWITLVTVTTGDARYLQISNNLSDLGSASTARSNLGLVIGTNVQAYSANIPFINVVQNWTAAQQGAETTLTDAASISINLASSNNFKVTLGGNRTLSNPSNPVVGQSGVIKVAQDGTGSRTLSFGTYYKFPAGTAPTLTTTASAIDTLHYYVISTTQVLVSSAYNWS